VNPVPFADLVLSRRLERAEGRSCAMFVEARARLMPDSSAQWIEAGGAYAMFDSVGSPVTQTFGLGMFETATPAILDELEAFFRKHGSVVHHEVSPLAGVETAALLVSRGYRPIELTSILYRPIEAGGKAPPSVRAISSSEAGVWADISSRAWSHDVPALEPFLKDMSAVSTNRPDTVLFIADVEGTPAATAALNIHEGVALLAGAATLPELRRKGAQIALLDARLQYAAAHGCDLAMMGALPGSTSQKNAERNSFRIAYTRTKWELP
jgi:GNAT superfamily N-acetyltransferase